MRSLTLGLAFFATLLLTLPSGYAQSIKKKGWIVLNNGDTLHGWLNYRNWEKNPSTISFAKDSLTEDFSKYSKHDLQSIYVHELDYYQKAIIQKDTRPVTLADLLPSNINPSVTDTALLRVLIYGSPYTLYEMVDEKTHFFIKAGDGEIKELTYRVVSLESGSISYDKAYIRQLKALLHNSTAPVGLLKKIDAAQYKDKELTRIVREMNGLSGNVQYTAPVASQKLTTAFFVGAGAGFSSLRFSGDHTIFGNMKYSVGFAPFATIGVDIASARNLQAIVLRPELSFSTASYEGNKQVSGTTTSYEVSQVNISPSLSLLYNFVRKESLRIYIGGGAAYNVSFYTKNRYMQTSATGGTSQKEDYLDYPGGWISISAKLGAKVAKKLEVGANAQLMGAFTNYTLWGFTPNTYTAQVRYFFH